MPTKKKSRRRRAVRAVKRRWRRMDKRFPISAGAGLAVSIVASPGDGWGSVLEKVQNGAWDQAAQSFISSWTGLKIGGIGGQATTEFDAMKSLNPFDFSRAPAWKTTFWTHVIFRVVKRFTGDPMSKIPFLGKYIKMS